METETIEKTETKPAVPWTNDGDHEKFAHYVAKPRDGDLSASAYVMKAMVQGTPIRALCGKYWIPTRDPERYPVCPECDRIRIQNNMMGF